MCKNNNRLTLMFVYENEGNYDKSCVEMKEASHILYEKNKTAKNCNLGYTKNVSSSPSNYIPLVHEKRIKSLALIYNTFTYIPFNPGICEKTDNYAWQQLQTEKTGEIFYVLPEIDASLTHEFPCGKKIPLYRWAQRHWLFTRFDEGVQIEPDGFMDITPESVAKHISNKMYSIISCLKDGKTQDSFTETNYKDEKNITTDSTRIPKPCSDVYTLFLNRYLTDKSDTHSNDEITQIQSNAFSETKTMCKENNIEANEPLGNVENISNLTNNPTILTNDIPDVLDWVIEACSGFGCNTIQFAKRFQKVIALEKNETRLNMAKQNAALYNVNNIHYFQGDAFSFLKTAGKYVNNKVGWFFASPPWGGEGYKDKPYFSCCESLGGCNIEELVVEASKCARNIALYLPPHQLTHELINLAQQIEGCGLVYVEDIAIGLKKKIKYKVVYFLEEGVLEKFIPGVINTFTKILVHELQEPRNMVLDISSLIKALGYRKVLTCLKNSINVRREGTGQDTRTKGGMFFLECRNTCGEQYRSWDRKRKKLRKQRKSKKPPMSDKNILKKSTCDPQKTNEFENRLLYEKLVDTDVINNTECVWDTPTKDPLVNDVANSPNTPTKHVLANNEEYLSITPTKHDTANKLEFGLIDGVQDFSVRRKQASSTERDSVW